MNITQQLVIVEGVTDAWRIGPSAVALLGKRPSERQRQMLLQLSLQTRTVYVALDQDALNDAEQLTLELRRRLHGAGISLPVRCLRLPADRKDWAECSREQFFGALECAQTDSQAAVVCAGLVTRRSAPHMTLDDVRAKLINHATGTAIQQGQVGEQINQLGMAQLFETVETHVLPILHQIEAIGLRVDRTALSAAAARSPAQAAHANRIATACNPMNGRIYTNLDPLGTRTGRITARNFALQNVPRALRAGFVSDPGTTLMYADYAQFEWRIAAGLSSDPWLLQVFSSRQADLYCTIAMAVFGLPASDCITAEDRERIKNAMMWFLFSPDRFLSSDPLRMRLSQFLIRTCPVLCDWLGRTESSGVQNGSVRTPFGRLIRLDRDASSVNSRRQSVACNIQGTAADVFKLAIIRVWQLMRENARILLPHHDAILVDCDDGLVSWVTRTVQWAMELPQLEGRVPFAVRINVGRSWAECAGGCQR